MHNLRMLIGVREGDESMPLWDPLKRRDPTAKEQANWDRLFAVEKEKQRQKRDKMKHSGDAAKRSMLDRFRSPF